MSESINLPETITMLPDLPSWELMITVTQDKRNRKLLTIHVALIEGLWSEMGMNQPEPSSRITRVVYHNKHNHYQAATDIAEWIWEKLESGTLRKLRFSTGKFMNDKMKPSYDNCVDVDISLVLEEGGFNDITFLIDKMLDLNRIMKRLTNTGREDGSKVRAIQSK